MAGIRDFYLPEEGHTLPFEFNPGKVFCFGLTYSSHVKEIGIKSSVSVLPPIFKKDVSALEVKPSMVKMPGEQQILEAAEKQEQGLADKIRAKCRRIDPLMDYEVELAFVLLDDIRWDLLDTEEYAPPVGFFLSNDVSSRFLQVLGEGRADRLEYWGTSKSFPGFLPVNNLVWIAKVHRPDAMLLVELKCMVNGEVRQQELTSSCNYSPKQMLRCLMLRNKNDLPAKGDIVLTGTPGGVAFYLPEWKKKISDLLRLSRFTKLNVTIRRAEKIKLFLKPGDLLTFSGEILGTVSVNIG